jgi:hypothetical protein
MKLTSVQRSIICTLVQDEIGLDLHYRFIGSEKAAIERMRKKKLVKKQDNLGHYELTKFGRKIYNGEI